MKYPKAKYRLKTYKLGIIVLLMIGITLGVSEIDTIKQYLSKASVKPANLKIDAESPIGSLKKPWQNLAQGGEFPEFSLTPMLKDIKELDPAYIRIDHLYDFYIKVSRDNSGKLEYDFSKLDKILKEMKSVNAKPFLSLSYMPDILSSDITGSPGNWSEYGQIIQATIEHVSGKNNQKIKDVYYEIWNEPDLFGSWKTYGSKNYLTMYTVAAKAAAAAKNTEDFKIGGPATTKLYNNWIDNLMKTVVAENLKLDFFSWHHYTESPEDYREDILTLKERLKQFPTKALKTEFIISEWGPNSDNDPAYDGEAAAAHLVASISEMMPEVTKAFVFEIQDGKHPEGKEFWGRWGLFTHLDFKSKIKPRAQAIKLLNQLGQSQLNVSGDGSHVKAIAAKKGEVIQVIISNYDPSGLHTEDVPLSIMRIKPGTYLVTRNFLNKTKSTEKLKITGSFKTKILMPPNSVFFIELTPE